MAKIRFRLGQSHSSVSSPRWSITLIEESRKEETSLLGCAFTPPPLANQPTARTRNESSIWTVLDRLKADLDPGPRSLRALLPKVVGCDLPPREAMANTSLRGGQSGKAATFVVFFFGLTQTGERGMGAL